MVVGWAGLRAVPPRRLVAAQPPLLLLHLALHVLDLLGDAGQLLERLAALRREVVWDSCFTAQRRINQSINVLFNVQSHHGNGHTTFLDNNINTLIKQSDTDITEWTEIVRGKQQVTARIDFNSEGGQQVTFHSAPRIKMT